MFIGEFQASGLVNVFLWLSGSVFLPPVTTVSVMDHFVNIRPVCGGIGSRTAEKRCTCR